MNTDSHGRKVAWAACGVFASILLAQLLFVGVCGTDMPWGDAWDAEGRWLYPAWRDGTWSAEIFYRAHNEHRIFWTKALDVVLFSVNGQWDPLVQLVAGAVLRAWAAATLAGMLVGAMGVHSWGVGAISAGVGLAFLPHLAWHNALWAFQSQVYFSLGFSILALGWLGVEGVTGWRRWAGITAGAAGLFSMAGSALVPVALMGLLALRVLENKAWSAERSRELGPAVLLLGLAWALRVDVPEHAGLRAQSAVQWAEAFLRALAWPHAWQPLAALVLNAPLAWVVTARVMGKRRAVLGEDFVVLLGGWAVAMAGAMAWSRGASEEFSGAVPSRYVDFLVLLPLANLWCAVVVVREARARVVSVVGVAWGVFLLVGWVGLSMEMMRGIVFPRMRDREAPVRLVVAFQRSGDAAVFAGQPRLLAPHPNPESVRAVLTDELMREALPPSLQPKRPMGPLSRVARWVLGR